MIPTKWTEIIITSVSEEARLALHAQLCILINRAILSCYYEVLFIITEICIKDIRPIPKLTNDRMIVAGAIHNVDELLISSE